MSSAPTKTVMPTATVRRVSGQLVLEDPVALGMIRAVGKRNCIATFEGQSERVAHFLRRMEERNLTKEKFAIVLINVNDTHGEPFAEILMPGTDWQAIRDRGETPFARGIVDRMGMQAMLSTFDEEAAGKLSRVTEVAVVVIDHGVAEVFIV